ncbi:MAG TPA: HDOD domain-containing protein [Candidatus Acidoferrales bacterium]|nr:HDOD domain-containing protein [Candidatus Acidoferrales bacterium]
MAATLIPGIRERVARIQTTPAIPMVLQPLLKMLAIPAEDVDVNEIVRLISYDNTIAAQCLRAAGSPLFGLAQPPKSIATAVVVLGLRRVESILLTCCMGQAFPGRKSGLDPTVFWKHSLGCAMVCRKFREKLARSDGEKAYVAGLLHDIGFLVSSLVVPNEFATAVAKAAKEQVALHLAETATMRFTHCETGHALAQQWSLAPEIANVIAYHHSVEECPEPRSLVALVHLSDLICRMRGLAYGYYERQSVDLLTDPAWTILAQEYKELAEVDLELFTFELDDAVREISELGATIFGRAA